MCSSDLLAKKWPLVAITNGNAQPELFGLGDYFEFVLRAGPHGRSKPFSDMYFLAAEKLNVPIGEILHVGDDLTTDVGGAIRSGMQACWIRPENGDLMQTWDSRLLPHLEISRLASLTSLIYQQICIYTQLFGGGRCASPPNLFLRGGANGRFLPARQP